MKKIYLILIAVLVFSCSADEDENTECHPTAFVNTYGYTDEFSYFEDKPLRKESITTIEELEIINESIFNSEECRFYSTYTLREDGIFYVQISSGSFFSSPNDCTYTNDDYSYDQRSIWTPYLVSKTNKDCSIENMLKIEIFRGTVGKELRDTYTYTVEINENSLTFSRDYTYFNKQRTERTVYVISNP